MVRCIVLNLKLIRTPHLIALTPSIPSALPNLHRGAPKSLSGRHNVCAWTPNPFLSQGFEKKALTPQALLPPRQFCAPVEQPPFRVGRACFWIKRKEPQE